MSNEGIVVYSTKGDVIFTSTGEIKVLNKKTVRNNKNIINPVFDNLKKYNTDNNRSMETFLSNAARNVFDKKYKYINGILYKKEYKKRSDIYINYANLSKTYVLLENFILENKVNKINVDTKMVRKIDDKEILNNTELINLYIIFFKNKNNLSYNETLEFESFLKILFLSEFITYDNLVISDNKIDYIKYLSFDKEKRKFYIDKIITPKILKKEIKKVTRNDVWLKKIEKFLSHINKNT